MKQVTKLGEYLKTFRWKVGHMQKDMAKVLGMPAPYLSAIESGAKKPPKYFRDRFVSRYSSHVTGEQLQELDNILKE